MLEGDGGAEDARVGEIIERVRGGGGQMNRKEEGSWDQLTGGRVRLDQERREEEGKGHDEVGDAMWMLSLSSCRGRLG